MAHLVILPILLPLIAGSVLLLAEHLGTGARRAIALAATIALLPVALLLLDRVGDGTHLVYALGDWAPPFGIVLVADRLAVAMLLLTAVVAVASLVYAGAGDDARGPQYHALFQFQLLGINGAFLTGDLVNGMTNIIADTSLALAPISKNAILPVMSVVGVLIGAVLSAKVHREHKIKRTDNQGTSSISLVVLWSSSSP